MLFRKKPLISIIVPSFNQGKFIERAILSILNQPYQNKELIVMDGGSTDETVKILKKYNNQITWVSEPDEGYADAVNKALKLANGEIIGIQSSDDYYEKNIFSTVEKAFTKNKQIGMVSARRFFIDADGNITSKDSIRNSQIFTFADILTQNYIPPQDSTFVKKECITSVGGLSINVDYCADVDLWMRILGNGVPGLLLGNQYWSYRSFHDEQRASTGATKFAEDAKKSVDNWINSDQFPEALGTEIKTIQAFGFLRRAYYYNSIGNYEQTKKDLEAALELAPKYMSVPNYVNLFQKHNIATDNSSFVLDLPYFYPKNFHFS
jgi:glycosyltransferase involved in cell wall biosynthesis